MPTLTQLQYLLAVDEFRHFGQAARACFVSQPSLSMQIQKVEEEIGFAIFDREKKPILATPRGARFLEQARRVLAENQKLLDVAKEDLAGISGEFRLGIIPTLAPYLLPRFIHKFSVDYPRVHLQIEQMKTDSILDALEGDRLDAGLLATPLSDARVLERPLFYEAFSLYLAPDHPWTSRKRIRQEELETKDLWLLGEGHCLRSQVVRVCGSAKGGGGVFPNVHFEGGDIETLRNLIRKSRGYTIVPELFVDSISDAEKRASVRPFEKPVPAREISLVYRRSQWKTEILKVIENAILDQLPATVQTLKSKDSKRIPI
jgi:LysR family transcriptional regulator, hydrogen peroxide-inducible genes activator